MDAKAVTAKEKMFWALGLGGLFFLAYGGTNYVSAGLEGLPSLYMPWEREIPFIDWMIIPYMSLDVFFVASLFLTVDRRELLGHAGRILMALIVSCALFLIYPMQFGFTRPDTSGLYGWLFTVLAADLPYNQCPSLHVSFSLICWPLVRRMSTGWGRRILAPWFVLIVASTLTVYQHHFIDVIAGVIVGLLTMHTIPLKDGASATRDRQSLRLTVRYTMASSALIALAAMSRGWAWLLLHPALSLALVASAYASGRADFLQKRHGRYCAVIWILFAPYLLGTHAVWHYYRRNIPAWNRLEDGIFFGRRVSRSESIRLKENRIRAVLDLSPEVSESGEWGDVDYFHLPMLDFASPDMKTIYSAVEFIKRHRTGVYIHCSLGLSRSVLVVAALLISEGMSHPDAIARVADVRSGILVGQYARTALRRFSENHNDCRTAGAGVGYA